MPDPMLPPEVYQGMGWNPSGGLAVPPPSSMPGGPPDFGGLPPSIPQGLGWAPPPDTAPMEPALQPPPTSLPSMQDRQPYQSGGASGRPDYQVPASAFGAGIKPPSPTRPTKPVAPSKPPTFSQGMANLQQREAETEQKQQEAIQAGTNAQTQLHADQLAAYKTADETVKANAADRKAEDENWTKAVATNQAKVDADRKQIDSWKFNRNAYMDSLGVGGKVRWGIGMILAGIGQGMMRQAGPNPVLAMLQDNIHDANVAQYKERDALVEKLGYDRQTGQDAATYHSQRQADLDKKDGLAYTALGKQLEEAALKSADPIAQANGLKEAANVRAMGDERLKSYIQLQSQHDLQAQSNAIAGGHLALAQKQFDWTKEKDQQELDLKAAALLAKKDGKLTEEESKRAIFIPGPDGKPIPAMRQDGTVVLAADPGDAGKIRRQVASTSTYNALIGKMSRGIEAHGGESDWWHSKEWQDMKTDYKAAVAELHEAYGVQSFREPTIEFFDNMTSAGLDPTSFNKVRDNATEALKNSNRNIQLKMNGLLSAQGYNGEPIQWEDTTAPPQAPTQSQEEKTLSRGLLNPHRAFDKLPGVLATELGNFSPRGALGPNETIDTRLKQEGEILPSVRRQMETLGAALDSPDMAVRRWSREWLDKLANSSESPETAALAQQLLERAQARQIGATPGAANAPEVVRGSSGAPR